ncbi:MAG TPA: mersacidin/lichenicidin family type 2 lantibiotic [Thermoanaerobaculia bacterium]|nr:mersacidin/lichenicidin family type 2 lantibiotic [Thermoanaerobaculia bacterium]
MKKNIDVSRAWRDEDYYLSLTEEERADLGPHPAGVTNVADETLRSITGGCGGNKTPYVTVCYFNGETIYCN